MRPDLLERNRYENIKQTFILLLSMMSLMYLLGWVLGGVFGIIFAATISITMLIVNPYNASWQILKGLRAKRIDYQDYPELYGIVDKISRRAELNHLPTLYCIPSRAMNAFVIGKEGNAAIVLTDSLLRNLNLREISGILGHEVAHIRNNDLWVMSIADATVRIVHFLSTVGQVALLLALPALLLGDLHSAFLPLLLLIFAPTICLFLQMALSRTREFEADRMGVQLVEDAYGLISALEKLDDYHKGVLSRFFLAPWRLSRPSLLQTHPPTRDRIRRLMSMTEAKDHWLAQVPWQHRVPHGNTLYSWIYSDQ